MWFMTPCWANPSKCSFFLATTTLPRPLFDDQCPSALFLGAVAQSDMLLGRILLGGGLDDRAEQRAVRRHPVADDVPLLAVPLLKFDGAAALVVRARQLQVL